MVDDIKRVITKLVLHNGITKVVHIVWFEFKFVV